MPLNLLVYASLIVTIFTVASTNGSDDAKEHQCVPTMCDYENYAPGQALANPLAIDWTTMTIERACSCAPFCAFYGDCCADSLEISRQILQGSVLKREWPEIERLRDLLQPSCRQLDIGLQNDSTRNNTITYINVQIANKECDGCYVDDITRYTGPPLNSTEIMQRLPVYYEDLGIVFPSFRCAKCFQNELDMTKIRLMPLSVVCDSKIDVEKIYNNESISSDSEETKKVFCHYSLNISAVQERFPQLALCLPVDDDAKTTEKLVCEGIANDTRKFEACTPDSAITNLFCPKGKPLDIYKVCSEEGDWCGQNNIKNSTSIQCVQKGQKLPKRIGSYLTLIDRIQRSDFSYRYMFDLAKLAANDAVMHPLCAGANREIFIERWRICVRRRGGDITIGVQPASSTRNAGAVHARRFGEQWPPVGAEREWLDFSASFFLVGQEPSLNKTILTKENDPDFKLDSECFRYRPITFRFSVSYECLCEIFRKTAETPSAPQRSIPRDDLILSLAGSLSIWISVICLLAVIVILGAFPKLRNRPAKLVMLLSTFLCIGMSMVLVNIYADVSVIRPRHKKEPTYEERCLRSSPLKETVCNLIGTTLHFSYLASFCLASALYIELWRSVRKSSVGGHSSSRRLFLLVGICCAIPLAIVASAVVLDQVDSENRFAPRYAEFVCWISSPDALLVFFVCPVVTALLVDIIFVVLISRQIHANSFRPPTVIDRTTCQSGTGDPKLDAEASKRRREERRKKHLRRLGIYVKMALIMGLTWLIGCIAPFIPEEYAVSVVLWYGFVILNGLQGVFIFYTYVLNKRTIQVIRETYQPKSATTRLRNAQQQQQANNSSSTSTTHDKKR